MHRGAWLGGAVAAILLLGGFSGCGGGRIKTYPVEGKVVVKGKSKVVHKLVGGQVRFRSLSDTEVVGVAEIGDDGAFTVGCFHKEKDLPGLPAGDYQVRIEPPRPDDDDDSRPKR